MCVQKGWNGLLLVLLLTVSVIMSCNRNTIKQTKSEPLSASELIKQKNQVRLDSVEKALAEIYWYLNPDNVWLRERARITGHGSILFNESVKMTPEKLLFTHKEHLGFLPEDTFVVRQKVKLSRNEGYDIYYDRYYKDALVVTENIRVAIGTDGYVKAFNGRYIPNVDELYEAPKITAQEAKQLMIKALREKITYVTDSLLDIWETQWEDHHFDRFALRLPFSDIDKMHYHAQLWGPKSIEILIYDCTIDASTGKIIEMKSW